MVGDFKVRCIKTVGVGCAVFHEGEIYNVKVNVATGMFFIASEDFAPFMSNGEGTVVDPDRDFEGDFFDYFETTFTIKSRTLARLMSWENRRKTYEQMSIDYFAEDIVSHTEDWDKPVYEEEAHKIARDYVENGKGDNDLPYWENVEGAVEQYRYYEAIRLENV